MAPVNISTTNSNPPNQENSNPNAQVDSFLGLTVIIALVIAAIGTGLIVYFRKRRS
jgi:hypothetical protein